MQDALPASDAVDRARGQGLWGELRRSCRRPPTRYDRRQMLVVRMLTLRLAAPVFIAAMLVGPAASTSRPAPAAHQAPLGDPLVVQAGLLREALETYEQLAADRSLPALPPFGAVVHPGERHPGLPALRAHLVRLGDHPPGPSPDAERYDDALVEAVRRFQRRHGLEVDGIIGRATEGALLTPLRARVGQIEAALETIARLAPLAAERVVVVNVPMFQLWAWDYRRPGGGPAVASRVIVGTTATPTPSFDAAFQEVIFRPEWNVPASIVRNEIVPRLARDPDYLRRSGLQIVSRGGSGSSSQQVTPDTLARLRAGTIGMRQPPGPSNALGLIKLMAPNPYDVYLHDTPSRALFDEPRRAFSHGCIRVAEPAAMARWLLDDEAWTIDRVAAVTAGPSTRSVPLAEPVALRLVYLLAMVWPDGTVHFAEDLYDRLDGGRDDAGPTGCPA